MCSVLMTQRLVVQIHPPQFQISLTALPPNKSQLPDAMYSLPVGVMMIFSTCLLSHSRATETSW